MCLRLSEDRRVLGQLLQPTLLPSSTATAPFLSGSLERKEGPGILRPTPCHSPPVSSEHHGVGQDGGDALDFLGLAWVSSGLRNSCPKEAETAATASNQKPQPHHLGPENWGRRSQAARQEASPSEEQLLSARSTECSRLDKVRQEKELSANCQAWGASMDGL
ncbi:hypothetical protein P7K49_031301 [Saguinus oedipus]|uniref:Uncharacterized protein n=1 Tax=Saguinus oedipus TaxID=9490 RepID=A0ABQ9TZU0_SAGOE|nr:hypothetical protein P7K49_031301 [Saguinus oedipus]